MYSPLMLFLSETKCLITSVEKILQARNYDVIAGMDSQGKSGGLVLAVKKNVSLVYSVESVTDHCIHVKSEINKLVCYVSCVYGYPQVQDRHLLWQWLEQLGDNMAHPWVVIGDFKHVFFPYEKLSGCSKLPGAEWCLEFLQKLQLLPLLQKGCDYT